MANAFDQHNIEWDEALRPCKKKPRLHNTDEALCPSQNAPSHNTGALVEASSAVAIAKSHGIETEWNVVFAIGENISRNGGDGQVYQAKTLRGQKLALLKFVYADEHDAEKPWREFSILRMFDHPNIVRLLGTYIVGSRYDLSLIHI